MMLPSRGSKLPTKSTVYADFVVGHTPAGAPFLKRVHFHLNPFEQALAEKASQKP
jgi:hypothetical protein